MLHLKKKIPEDITILHLCTENLNDMIYSSWDIKCNRQILLIMDHFLPFYPTNSPKNEFQKMKTTPRDIIILHKCTKNYDQMMYGSGDMVRNGQIDGQK